MRPPICTIDASIVIALDYLNLLPQLSLLFSRVLLPRAVRVELFKRRATKNRLRSLLREYSFIERCDNHDRVAVDILLVDRMVQGVEDRGEAEAVVQAAETDAVVMVDDPWGRGLAARFGREFHGTVWILRRFYELGLISGLATRANFVELLNRGIRLPLDAVNDFLSEISTPAIDLRQE
jgi:predicted nucleic acid-binding protein